MQVKLFISATLESRLKIISEALQKEGLTNPYPDLLFLGDEEKLGVEQAKQIRQFLSIKPYQAKLKAVVIISAQNLTPDAQNSLLKTLEEPPENSLILLGAEKESQLLPTILSRVEIVKIKDKASDISKTYSDEIEKLQSLTMKERFQFIEKLEEKEEFLLALTKYFRKNLGGNTEFAKRLISAEEWAASNGNIRAILEYLMLELPSR